MAKTTTTVVTERETTIETYDNPDFVGIVRETVTLRKVDEDGKEASSSSRSVSRAAGVSHADYCKALVLALARYGKLLELPYTISGVSSAGRIAECLCLDCRLRWSELPSERKTTLGQHTCPNGHVGAVILTGAELPASDPELWYIALTDDNSPGKVSFREGKDGYARFRDLVMPLDFRVYCDAKAADIRAMYIRGSTAKVVVDADLIIQGELGELEGQQA